MAAAIGFALPESLRAAPDSVQPGSRLVAGAGGHEGDASHFQYLELVGRGDAFRYRVAAETRRAPTRIPRGSAGFGNERTLKEGRHAHLSLDLQNDYFHLMAGNRFLPGPRNRFLSHSVFYSGFADIPAPRETESVFLQPGRTWWNTPKFPTPGIFAVADHAGPGLFLADSERTLLAAWHFASRRGVLALDRKWGLGAYRGRLQGDVVTRAGMVEGDLTLDARPSPEAKWSPRVTAEFERRAYQDDFRLAYHDEDTSRRRGRSGLGSLRVEWSPRLMLEAAGEDRGLVGMRLVGRGQ